MSSNILVDGESSPFVVTNDKVAIVKCLLINSKIEKATIVTTATSGNCKVSSNILEHRESNPFVVTTATSGNCNPYGPKPFL